MALALGWIQPLYPASHAAPSGAVPGTLGGSGDILEEPFDNGTEGYRHDKRLDQIRRLGTRASASSWPSPMGSPWASGSPVPSA